jgi:hypothetical protein
VKRAIAALILSSALCAVSASAVRALQQGEPPPKPAQEIPAAKPPDPPAKPGAQPAHPQAQSPKPQAPPATPATEPAKPDALHAPLKDPAQSPDDAAPLKLPELKPSESPAVLASELHADFASTWSADAYDAYVARIAHVFPDLVQLSSIGKSRSGRDLWVLAIGDARSGDPGGKPALCLCSAFGADPDREGALGSPRAARADPRATLYALVELLIAARARPDLAAFTRESTLYVLPATDPDATFATAAAVERRGRASRLDRNFPVDWQPWGDAPSESGPYPLSEPETQSVARFLGSRANIAAMIVLSRDGALAGAKAAAPDPPSDDRDAGACDRWCASAVLARDEAAAPRSDSAANVTAPVAARPSSEIERHPGDFASFCDTYLGLAIADVSPADGHGGPAHDTRVGPAPAGFDALPAFVEAAWRKLPRLLVDAPKVEHLRANLWMIDVGVSNPGLLATLPARVCDGAAARSVWVRASGAKLIAAAAKRDRATSFEALRTQDGGAPLGQLAGEERMTVRLVVEGAENAAVEIALNARRAGEKKISVALQ